MTALVSRGVVAVSDNTTRDNPFVAHVIPHGVDEGIFTPWPVARSPEPSASLSAPLMVASVAGFCSKDS